MVKLVRGTFLVAALLGGPALAAPPEGADPALAPWFKTLTQPGTGAACCTIADCLPTQSRRVEGGYEALIDERFGLSRPFWVDVPPHRILERTDNPTGRAVACFTPEAGLMCFVRPPDS